MAVCYYIGVDVGTASVRAALVANDGKIVSCATRPLQIWQPLPDYYEQSSEDVWRNVCSVVKVFVDNCNNRLDLGKFSTIDYSILRWQVTGEG